MGCLGSGRDIAMRTVITLAGAFSLLIAAAGSFAAPVCPTLVDSTPASRLEYLQGDRSRLSLDCILVAVGQLGYDKYTLAIKVLIGYLGYRAPEKTGLLKYAHIESTGSIYPASSALYVIGKPAVPQLVETIANAATSDLVRNISADVVSMIYREDLAGGVAVLARAARAQTDPLASAHLMDQARRQAAHCGDELRNDCENAIVRENH